METTAEVARGSRASALWFCFLLLLLPWVSSGRSLAAIRATVRSRRPGARRSGQHGKQAREIRMIRRPSGRCCSASSVRRGFASRLWPVRVPVGGPRRLAIVTRHGLISSSLPEGISAGSPVRRLFGQTDFVVGPGSPRWFPVSGESSARRSTE